MTSPDVDAAIRHITAYSHPSPFVSLTASYEVALSYAIVGPSGRATRDNPGYVYEIDTERDGPPMALHHPVVLIAEAMKRAGATILPAHHDGGQDVILGVAANARFRDILTRPARRLGVSALSAAPAVRPELTALIYALRDSEILAERVTPAVWWPGTP